MNIIKYILPLFIIVSFLSCSSNNDDLEPINEVEDLLKIKEISNDTHIIELYSESGVLELGYNELTIRIKNKTSDEFVENATISWKPVMHMTNMSHSCPKSELAKVAGRETIYDGFIVFQMPENATEGWNLTFNYSINGVDYQAIDTISIPAQTRKRVTTFMGTDGVKYIAALVAPSNPEVATNDITIGLYKMENMMSFPAVEDYIILLDPRMPSMGNHSSPNNQDLTYDTSSKMYQGKLSLTMTGYWKLNLILQNSNTTTLKGEEVTDLNEGSSLFLEIEF